MTGTQRAVSCAGILLFACLAALVAPAQTAHASDLVIKPGLDTSGRGLTVRSRGVGLADPGTDFREMSFGSFNGPIRQAVLYWGGFHPQGGGTPQATLEVTNVGGSTVNVAGTLVGTDAGQGQTWFAYRADLTSIVQGLAGGGAVTVRVRAPQSMPASTVVNGASVFVSYTDPMNPSFYRARIAEGSQFIFNAQTTPVTYQFDPAVLTRPAQLSVAIGNASPLLRDVILITDNEPRIDELRALEGNRWDAPSFSVFVPASASQTQVTVVSPEIFGNDADRLHVIAMSYRLICGGQIGDFVWLDQNGNGIQDPGEPGVSGVRLILELLDDITGEFIELGETVSDAGGLYRFEGLCAGIYRVKADPSSFEEGVVPVAPFQGNDDTIDSDFFFDDGFFVAFVDLIDDGDSNLDIDLGLSPGITIFTGACCLPDGSCIETFAATCNGEGGTFFGIGIPCSSVQCEPPVVACCLPNGDCVDVTAAACAAQGGTSQGFPALCAGVTCTQPAFACCLPDGTCVDTTEIQCIIQGGAPQQFPALCADVTCPQPALACCLPSGDCVNVTEAQCVAQGGTSQPFPAQCADVTCPQPAIACCLPNGDCINVTEAECATQGGAPQPFPAQCADVKCPQPALACCLPNGDCINVTQAACTALGGDSQPFPAQCADVTCPQPVIACCLPNGDCIEVTAEACASAGGGAQPFPSDCASADCEQPNLACCLPSGECINVPAAGCVAQGGTPQPFPVQCAEVMCPQPALACCLPNGDCIDVTEADCVAQGGTPQPFPAQCADVMCPQPLVACCLPSGQCVDVTEAQCLAQGGAPEAFPVLCNSVSCPTPMGPTLRVRAAEKGSLLYFSKVDVRWNTSGHIVRDTFISLTNDHPDDVRVLMYFINGDEPLSATPGEPAHPGWNFVDNAITLTGQQPVYWSAATGDGTVGGLSPFLVLDPGMPPGRPVGDGSGDRMIRGFIVGWATTADGKPIRFNHLAGAGTIVDYRETSSWEYPAFAFRAVAGMHGSTIGTAGMLKLDGEQYASGYEQLLASFQAIGSSSLSTQNKFVQAQGTTTIHPVDLDLRLNAADAGPVTTRIMVDVWNENEVKFSGTSICVTCWSSELMSAYKAPNQFRLDHLQTERGKARFRSSDGPACNGSAPHPLVSLLGLMEHEVRFSGAISGDMVDRAGGPMIGMGLRSAMIQHDPESLPPEAPERAFEDVARWLRALHQPAERKIGQGGGTDN